MLGERGKEHGIPGRGVPLPGRRQVADPRTVQTLALEHADEDVGVGVRHVPEWIRADVCRAGDGLRAGAAGYVLKSAPSHELFEAITAVREGRSYLSAAVAHEAIEAIRHPRANGNGPFDTLTGREREVLQRIAEGLGSKEIATDLHLSRRTVESHRAHLMRKLGVHKTSALVRIAIREGLVSP